MFKLNQKFRSNFSLCFFLLLLVVAGAISGPVMAADLTSAAPQIDVKACYQTSIKNCCDVAAGVDLTIECQQDEFTWTCVGAVKSNPMVNVAVSTQDGLQVKRSTGTDSCSYTKPVCGSSFNTCRFEHNETVATCNTSVAQGPNCRSPRLLADIGQEASDAELPVPACRPAFFPRR